MDANADGADESVFHAVFLEKKNNSASFQHVIFTILHVSHMKMCF